MSFNQNQIRKLSAKLRPQHVRTREADGITLSYLEGWHVVAEANRIFGFEGWDRETISSECVWSKQVNGRYCAAYVTRIRIRVRAGEAVIVREGSGAGESNAASPGQAHDFAAKAAETDATKRALMTFGNAFGLSLYGGSVEPRVKASPLTPAGLEPRDTVVSEPPLAIEMGVAKPSQSFQEEVENAIIDVHKKPGPPRHRLTASHPAGSRLAKDLSTQGGAATRQGAEGADRQGGADSS